MSKKPYPLNIEDYPDPYAWKYKTRSCCGAYMMNEHRHDCPEHPINKAVKASNPDVIWSEIEIDPNAQDRGDYRQSIVRVKVTRLRIESVPTGWRAVVKA